MVEGPLTHLRLNDMTYLLNRKLYIGQDLLGLETKYKVLRVKEIYQPCKDYIWNYYKPSSATNVFCGFFQFWEEISFLALHGEEDDQVLSFAQGENMT